MIQHKILNIKKMKMEVIEKELDNLSNYEGWISIHSIGKNSILLRKVLDYPPVQEQQAPKTTKKGKAKPFPDAVYE